MTKRGFRNYRQRGGVNIDTKAFMESNSMVARAAFCVLVLLAFIILMSFATKFLQWMFSPSKNPKLSGFISKCKIPKLRTFVARRLAGGTD